MLIPATFRKVIEASDPDWVEGVPARLIVVYGPDSWAHLQCFTVGAMDEVDAQIAKLTRGSPRRKALDYIYSGLSHETAVDGTGRLVLPKKLRDKIDLPADTDAYLIASGDTFQVWNHETYRQSEMQTVTAVLDELPSGADPLIWLDEGLGA